MPSTIEQIKAFFPIQTWDDNEFLRTKSEKVDIFDADLADFCDILLDLMYAYDWVWLAAPQVWKDIRVIATTQWKESKKSRKDDKTIIWETVMVNPEILEHSKEKIKREEGCLSVPWLRWNVERWKWIILKYQDKKWKQHVQKYVWFNSVIIQHEMDHLEWILFTDKVIWKTRNVDENSDD